MCKEWFALHLYSLLPASAVVAALYLFLPFPFVLIVGALVGFGWVRLMHRLDSH